MDDALVVWLYVYGSRANSFGFSTSDAAIGLAIEDANTAFATEFALDAGEYVPFPNGEVHKNKRIVQGVTLPGLDVATAMSQGGQDILSLMCLLITPRETKIAGKLWLEINKIVTRYADEGVAKKYIIDQFRHFRSGRALSMLYHDM